MGKKPDFICIGASKAGTTWLHAQLRAHPALWLPHVKELHYLNKPETKRYASLLFKPSVFGHHMRVVLLSSLLRGRPGWAYRYLFKPRHYEDYHRLFQVEEGTLAGEVTPNYAHLPEEDIKQLIALYPSLKVIYILRNPVDRVWSQANMIRKRKRTLQDSSEQQIFDRIKKRQARSSYYTSILAKWEQYLPQAQVHIDFYDHLVDDPASFLDRIAQFLGIAPFEAEQATIRKVYNQGRYEGLSLPYKQKLTTLFMEELQQLHARFDNAITARWLAEARQLLNKDT